MSHLRLAGKKALITGAARGLGEAIARAFVSEGAHVTLTDTDGDGAAKVARSINETAGARVAFALAQDVRDETRWKNVIAEASDAMAGLSVLVNNAGIVVNGTVEDISLEDWHRGMAVNVDSVFLGTKHALPAMRDCAPGSIINISSIAGLIASHSFANYNASKAAVWLLTKSVALHCARQGWDIRCNSIHPAFVKTPILEDLAAGRDIEEVHAKLARQVPLGRLGAPEDVAFAAIYLASDESRFMTGSELKLDGGISAM